MAVAAQSNVDLPRLGIVLMLAAWLLFSLVDTGAKWLAVAGIPAFQLAFMRYAGHFVISIGVVAKGGWSVDRFKTDHLWQVVSRAVLLVTATLSNFYALHFLPLTVASAIMFSSPVIVCFLSISVLGEKVGPWRWGAILLGFIGVLIVVRPFGTAFHPAMLLIIYNATALAFYSIMTRKLSGIVAVDTMQFYLGLVGTSIMAPFAIWAWVAPASGWAMTVLLGLGVMGWAGHQFLTNAHRFGSANQLMPFTYSFLIYVAIWGYLLFGTVPDFWTLIGAVVIMGAGLIIWKREQT
ncbi:DMT family transporter [Sulfitobacter geojensis]|uniref:DMT family transporter n=1 Tax=Sulfitobacter geojensis TaxID=1342299 RepID=A0AAE2VXT8_9RHOB|nr:DMT family transporter [Sulfitobacter geojensis]MBM1689361.1 DMT family transporter [Sulfitobacter geojensis]MBM1693427.1 DMT family transporter [Sulfitobacter geojensis]MBM1705593.1 DMT family transporter [Sulfitobacter geojensis]MBM1709651.1 DMT family transporter [Sulfitobacter geojensis]MBM1713717.1 DMT family transporter [Sulfitobacter geojensis]